MNKLFNLIRIFIIILFALSITSCKKDAATSTNTTSTAHPAKVGSTFTYRGAGTINGQFVVDTIKLELIKTDATYEGRSGLSFFRSNQGDSIFIHCASNGDFSVYNKNVEAWLLMPIGSKVGKVDLDSSFTEPSTGTTVKIRGESIYGGEEPFTIKGKDIPTFGGSYSVKITGTVGGTTSELLSLNMTLFFAPSLGCLSIYGDNNYSYSIIDYSLK